MKHLNRLYAAYPIWDKDFIKSTKLVTQRKHRLTSSKRKTMLLAYHQLVQWYFDLRKHDFTIICSPVFNLQEARINLILSQVRQQHCKPFKQKISPEDDDWNKQQIAKKEGKPHEWCTRAFQCPQSTLESPQTPNASQPAL